MILSLLANLRNPTGRMEAARALAEHLGFSHLIVLLVDPEIGVLLPASGFPQTFYNGEAWAAFIQECRQKGNSSSTLPYPDASTVVPVTGIAGPEGSVVIFTGGNGHGNTKPILDILPFIVDFLTQEQMLEATRIRAALADSAAEKASKLATMIDHMRLNLREALTREETAKHDIEELMAKKDEFMNVASHELKTPITSIKGYLQIIEKELSPDQQIYNFVNKAKRQVNKLAGLIGDLLDVSKIQTGQLPFHYTEFDLASLLTEVCDMLEQTNSGYTLELAIPNEPLKVRADQQRIEQVVINLISNGINYSPGKDRIVIRAELYGDQVRVSIQDFGIGIATDQHERIFSRFYRVENLATHISGLGIGLYISHEIISRHQGKMWLESEPEKGSTFYFSLPLQIADSIV